MKRKGIVITESLIIAIIGLATAFYGGAITEVETQGKVTSSINYVPDVNGTIKCKEE